MFEIIFSIVRVIIIELFYIVSEYINRTIFYVKYYFFLMNNLEPTQIKIRDKNVSLEKACEKKFSRFLTHELAYVKVYINQVTQY